MKKQFLFLMVAVFALGLWSCKEDEEDKSVKDLKVTATVNDNVVSFVASATNANTFSWDFADGNTGAGATIEHSYKMAGTYEVKCTAKGQSNSISKTESVKVETGDPSVYNEVSKLLTGYAGDPDNGGNTVWKWVHADGMFSCGPKSHIYSNDTAQYDIFDVYDDSWWQNNAASGEDINEEALDDEYSFKLNQAFEYVNSYKASGFMWNWAWAKFALNKDVDEWGDLALLEPTDTVASWELEIKDIPTDSTFRTFVNDQEVDKAYILHIKGGQYLGIASAAARSTDAHWYQIVKIEADSLIIRYDNTFPQDLAVDPSWEDTHPLGEGEWGYIIFAKSN